MKRFLFFLGRNNGRYLQYFLIVIILAIFFLYRGILILNRDKREKKKIFTIDKNFNVENEYIVNDDKRILNLWDSGKCFIINNSNKTLMLDPIKYGRDNKEFDKLERVTIYEGINSFKNNRYIHYRFESPPMFIDVPINNKGIIKWHLHK